MKVEQFLNKNQFKIYGEGKNIFQSYDSTIAIIENESLTLGHDWNYSTTTSKHLYAFLIEYKYDLNLQLREIISQLEKSKNKRALIQKAIDDHIIFYDENLI